MKIEPQLGPGNYKTYQIVAPRTSHWRSATCAEYGCEAHENGWKTIVDERTELGARQAHYIRHESRRRFREDRELSMNGLTAFVFEAGQECFAKHQVSLERDPFYFVKGGDFRGNPLGIAPRRHSRPEYWVEDFAEHQDRLNKQISGG